jgi:hypothetical protein
MTPSTEARAIMAKRVLDAAIEDLTNPDGRTHTGELAPNDKNRGTRWGFPAERQSIPQLARRIQSLGPLLEYLLSAAKQLGYSTRIRGTIGTLMQSEASFILTNGEGYSEEPATGLAGLAPVISMGNLKVADASRRWDDRFDTWPWELPLTKGKIPGGLRKIKYSAMAVKGHWSATAALGATGSDTQMKPFDPVVLVLEKQWIPEGMHMGEMFDDIYLVASFERNPILKVLPQIFETKGEGTGWYVGARYLIDNPETEGSPTTGEIEATSWDMWAIANTGNLVATALQRGYGDANGGMVTAPRQAFLYKEVGWHHRFVAAISTRGCPLEWYGEHGNWKTSLPQDGNVSYNDELGLPKGTAFLEQVLTVLDGSIQGVYTDAADAAAPVKD